MLVSYEITELDGISARHYTGPDWRMVHDGVACIALIPPPGHTATIQPCLMSGTEAELRTEANRLNLANIPPVDPPETIPTGETL